MKMGKIDLIQIAEIVISSIKIYRKRDVPNEPMKNILFPCYGFSFSSNYY